MKTNKFKNIDELTINDNTSPLIKSLISLEKFKNSTNEISEKSKKFLKEIDAISKTIIENTVNSIMETIERNENNNVDVSKVDDEYAYIEKSGFDSGSIIQNVDTQEEYTIGKTGSLKGVYNVNKGYCVFKQVEILYENDEYCIVSDKTYNGLSNYDHILLNSTTAKENEIIK